MSLYIKMAQRNAEKEQTQAHHLHAVDERRRRMQMIRKTDAAILGLLPQPPLDVQEQQDKRPQAGISNDNSASLTSSPNSPSGGVSSAMSTLCGSIAASRRVFRRPRTASEKEKARKDRFASHVKVSSTLIGSGAFGAVYLGVHEETGQWIAVKRLPIRQAVKSFTIPTDAAGKAALDEQLDELVEEIRVMRDLDHPNIVRYLHAERNDAELSIFMEYMSGGSLGSLLKKFEKFPESMVKVYMRQALAGVAYLHSKNIVHRDIKADNILLHSDGTAKLSDFGTSREFSESVNLLTVTGTPWFMAPEVVKGTGHGAPADIWSIGCTIIHLIRGAPPFDEFQSPVTAMYNIALKPERVFEYVPPTCSQSLLSALACCLAEAPEKRWTAAQLLSHDFFRTVLKGDVSDDISTDDEDGSQPAVPAIPLGSRGSGTVPLVVPLTQIAPSASSQAAAGGGTTLHRTLTPRSLASRLRSETQNQQLSSQAAFGSKSILEAGGGIGKQHPEPDQSVAN